MLSLKEQFAADLENIPEKPQPGDLMTRDVVSAVLEPFEGEAYGELAAILGMLEGMNVLMQTYHWKTNGDTFYADHSIYQRIYEGINEQIDAVGEKTVGMGSGKLASADKIIKVMDTFLVYVRANETVVHGAATMSEALMRRARYAEELFIETVDKLMVVLKDQGYLTRGVDNLLAGILDEHEHYSYFLKQRLSDNQS